MCSINFNTVLTSDNRVIQLRTVGKNLFEQIEWDLPNVKQVWVDYILCNDGSLYRFDRFNQSFPNPQKVVFHDIENEGIDSFQYREKCLIIRRGDEVRFYKKHAPLGWKTNMQSLNLSLRSHDSKYAYLGVAGYRQSRTEPDKNVVNVCGHLFRVEPGETVTHQPFRETKYLKANGNGVFKTDGTGYYCFILSDRPFLPLGTPTENYRQVDCAHIDDKRQKIKIMRTIGLSQEISYEYASRATRVHFTEHFVFLKIGNKTHILGSGSMITDLDLKVWQ